MPGFIYSSLSGREGSILIPPLGVVIGQMVDWKLKRRGDDGPSEGSYDLRAVLSYVNEVLFNHDEYASEREVRIVLNRQNEFRLEENGGKVQLEGMVLTMEGVTLCRL